jgi:hypothetical protein
VKTILALLLASSPLFAAPPAPPQVPLPPGYHGPIPAPRPRPLYPEGYECHPAKVELDSYGNLYKDGTKIGQGVKDYKADCIGNVAWKDGFDHLYRNTSQIDGGSFVESTYEIAFNTGDVIWGDSSSGLYKNGKLLGNAVRVEMNGLTGDVAWMDSDNQLYKNVGRRASAVSYFWFKNDFGKLQWQDFYGKTFED